MTDLVTQKELIPAPRGVRVRGPQEWDSLPSGYEFFSGGRNEDIIDIVLCDGYYYDCKTSHAKSSSTKPGTAGGSGYWSLSTQLDFVATRILLAQYALVKNLGVETIEMKDAGGNVIFQAKNGSVICNTGTFKNIKVTDGEFTGKLKSTNFYHHMQTITSDGAVNADTDIAIVVGASNSSVITFSLPGGSAVTGKVIEIFVRAGTAVCSTAIFGGGGISVDANLYTGTCARLYYDGSHWLQLSRDEQNPKDVFAESLAALSITQTPADVTSAKAITYECSMYMVRGSYALTLPNVVRDFQPEIIVCGNYSPTLSVGYSLHRIILPGGESVSSLTLSAYKCYRLIADPENHVWRMASF